MVFPKIWYFLLYTSVCINYGVAERLHEQIYSSIEGGAACFRRLNGTHQAGCSSSDKGAVGVVHMIKEVSDAEWVTFNSSAGPYVAVVSTTLFRNVIELFMAHPDNVAGILLFDNVTESVSSFSQESRCPNEYSSAPGSQCSSSTAGGLVWNDPGTGLLRRNIPFPIFFLPKTRAEEVDKIELCYDRYNRDKDNQKGQPLCSLQLSSFMFAAVNSEVCLRRSASTTFLTPTKVCDPLGDQNVYSSLFPRGKDTDNAKKSVIFVTARIDSASLFDGIAPGAASSVVGLVSLIAAASVLSHMIPLEDSALYNHNVMWTLFNGESFDYIGSQRVAYEMSLGAWPASAPLAPAQLRLHVELGQLGAALGAGAATAGWPLTAFAPYTADVPQEVTEFLSELSANLEVQKLSVTPEFTLNLPPSSLHSFRSILKNVTENGELPELLLADYKDTFSNKFYQSALDDSDNINFVYRNITINNGTFLDTDALVANGTMKESDMQVKIARFVTALARTLYRRVVGTAYNGTLMASAHMVDEMLFCLARSQACALLAAAEYAGPGGAGAAGEEPAARAHTLYVGVASWLNSPAYFAANLLALLAGTPRAVDQPACEAMNQTDFSFYWLKGWNHTGVCIQTTANFSQAISPAFIIPEYEFGSGQYSTWSESVWATMWARLFVSAGGGGARAAALSGAGATALAAALTCWLRRHARLVFPRASPPAAALASDAATGILRTVNC